VRDKATKDLIAVGKRVLPQLREATNSSDLELVRRVSNVIRQIERHEKIEAIVLTLQTDPDSTRRIKAAAELNEYRKESHLFVGALIKALDDSSLDVRQVSVSVLGNLGSSASGAIPRLLQILKDPSDHPNLRGSVADDLARIGHCEQQAVPVLLDCSESTSWRLRTGAARALGKLGGKRQEVVSALLKTLDDPNDSVRGNAAEALGCLGQRPEQCVPALVRLLRSLRAYDGDNDPRGSILAALGRFGRYSAQAVPSLIELAENKSIKTGLKRRAIIALGEIGPAAIESVPNLRAMAADPLFGEEATNALARITAKPK
jgi:HEAT repeat protein